jgi:hypothetical protein
VRENFVAAGLLAGVQIEGEKLRRYEKEMFIYVTNAGKRGGYVKEFDGAYTKLLNLLDTTLMPSGKVFSDEERTQILGWKNAAVFYANEFNSLGRKADIEFQQASTAEQRAAATVEYNNAIKAGKDRFRELLAGADKMRAAKEQSAQEIASDIDAVFSSLRTGVVLGGMLLIGMVLVTLRRRDTALANPMRAMPVPQRA